MTRFKHTLIGLVGLMCIASQPAAAQFSGCGMGAFGGMLQGNIDGGGPVGLESQGMLIGLNVNCDVKVQRMVFGLGADYGWITGDLNTLGFDNKAAIYGRFGILVTDFALLYGKVSWNRAFASGNHLDGWGLGGGAELKVPGVPLYIGPEYNYVKWDDIFPGANTGSHEFLLRASLKFGPGGFASPLTDDVPKASKAKP